MAGAFSGHLINSYDASMDQSIFSDGNISFLPNAHGTPISAQSSAFQNQSMFSSDGISDAAAQKIATLQVKLNQKLGPEYISQRPGPGGGPKLTYAEGWKIINLANEVFGFNGWSSNIISLTTDFIDFNEETRKYNIGVTAIMRVTLKDGAHHEDIGYGMIENTKSKAAGLDKCKKEAVTDGVKRTLRNFGNLLGNCLYDKSYTQEVVKIKVQPVKLDRNELHRHPDFSETKPNVSSSSSTVSSKPTSSNAPRPTVPPTTNNPQSTTSIKPEIRQPGPSTTASVDSNRPEQRQQPVDHNSRPNGHHKVSFVEPPRPPPAKDKIDRDPDDSFHFYSDDDALLAAVDLNDGNFIDAVADVGRPIEEDELGRPIEEDADLGRPINHDEARASKGSDLGTNSSDSERDKDPMNAKMNKAASSSRISAISAALGVVNSAAAGEGSGAATGMLSRLLPQKSEQYPQRESNQPSTSSRPRPPQPPPLNKPQPQQGGAGHNHPYNVNPQASSSGIQTKRLSTPSAGEFHIPPRANSMQPPGSGIGIKRLAEAMGPPDYIRGPRPGMGLQQATAALGQVAPRREVLGTLEVGEGGGIKRVRR